MAATAYSRGDVYKRQTLGNIKSRTVGDGQHGTARWATDKEIKQTYACLLSTSRCVSETDVWGTYGDVLTESLFAYQLDQSPDGVGSYADFIRAHWLGGRTTDCVGLIKGYGWLSPETMTIDPVSYTHLKSSFE